VHLVEELPRVGRQRLDIAALSLGVQRVERQRRLPRTRQSRDHDQLVARDLHVDVLEVVLSRALDLDAGDLLHAAGRIRDAPLAGGTRGLSGLRPPIPYHG
jgi:hypothetical protein